MSEKYRVGAYVKLAKLWERCRDEAVPYHQDYFRTKYEDDDAMELVDVYIDITGQKEIRKRPEMIRLLHDCLIERVDCISTQTQAYLAANNREFFYLLHFLFELPRSIDIVTEDRNYHINTIENMDHQKEALQSMVADYVRINRYDYDDWKEMISREITTLVDKDGE